MGNVVKYLLKIYKSYSNQQYPITGNLGRNIRYTFSLKHAIITFAYSNQYGKQTNQSTCS